MALKITKTFWVCGLIASLILAETAVYATFVPAKEFPATGESAGLTPKQALAYMRDTPDLLILDVRSRREYAGGHIPDSINIPLRTLPQEVSDIPTGRPILIHCGIGFRGLQAYKLIRRLRPELTELRYVQGKPIFSLNSSL